MKGKRYGIGKPQRKLSSESAEFDDQLSAGIYRLRAVDDGF